ncbi:hypothetical protein [Hymenobacter cellulosivorans]|uniref:Uncharacterized protein n=1 Tax=Hymenobacter cellulosivorans TaxID=2932249 RepID=A0ABY4FFC9_9BACT|nr:hypothetical protein [Hymenobacter cellulosivorans]UOQ55375.1 hypothetical protein MUN80_11610 [Hymenobacter cellulosivorans]
MLRSFLTWFLLFGTLALSACCANKSCDCRDTLDNVVLLRFDVTPGSPNAFARKDVDTIIITRKPLAPLSPIKPDTLRLIRTLAQADDSIALGQGRTFPSAALPFFKYQYKIWPASDPKQVFVVDSLHVQSRPEAVDGCCTCYQVIRKDLHLNGDTINLLDPTGQDKPMYVQLEKQP